MKLDDFNPVLFWDTDIRTLSVETTWIYHFESVYVGRVEGLANPERDVRYSSYEARATACPATSIKDTQLLQLVLEEPKENFRCYLGAVESGHWDY